MRQNGIRTGFSRYAAGALLALFAVGIAAPSALACAQHQPTSFWTQAIRAITAAQKAQASAKAAPKQPKAKGLKANRWVTGSRYELTTDTRVLFKQGCEAGRDRVNGLVILAFGKPAYNGHSYGTILFSNRFASNRQITRATRAYATGYARCVPKRSTAKIVLARGTSNYSPSTPSTYKAGRKWARETMNLAKFLRNHPVVAKRVKSAAGIDAEPAWDPDFRQTHDFFRGFKDARTGYLLYNFGSLDGGVGSFWNLRQAFYVAGGMKYARVVPEIYFRVQARQWAELARLAIRRYKRPVQFAGVMTQRWKGCNRRICGMTPREAHSQLGIALKQHPATRKQVRMLASVTNIQ
jgi:hypothetical protein